jgi:hypothetical protein
MIVSENAKWSTKWEKIMVHSHHIWSNRHSLFLNKGTMILVLHGERQQYLCCKLMIQLSKAEIIIIVLQDIKDIAALCEIITNEHVS